jgi:hypothetical protein
MTNAPAGHKGAGDRRIGQMGRDRIVQDAASAAWGHSPSILTSVLTKPFLDLVEALAESSIPYRNPDPHRKSALGLSRAAPRAALVGPLLVRSGGDGNIEISGRDLRQRHYRASTKCLQRTNRV